MLTKSTSLSFGVATVALAMVMTPASAHADVIWSWSFGSSTNGAAGTFTTTDVSSPNNPVGTYSVSQFTLEIFNGNPVSAIDTALANLPSFIYNSATSYGFTNALGFSDSGGQLFDAGAGTYLLSGSAAYEASLPLNRRRPNLVILGGTTVIQNRADLQVSLPPPPASVPEPQTLALAVLALGATVVARRRRPR